MPACHAGGHEFESRTHRKDTPSDEAHAPSDFFVTYNLKPVFHSVFHPRFSAYYRSKLLNFPRFSCSFCHFPPFFRSLTPLFSPHFSPLTIWNISHSLSFTFVKGHKWHGYCGLLTCSLHNSESVICSLLVEYQYLIFHSSSVSLTLDSWQFMKNRLTTS